MNWVPLLEIQVIRCRVRGPPSEAAIVCVSQRSERQPKSEMFVTYLLILHLLSIAVKSADSESHHSLRPSHCNYTIDRIDAITNFTNGSLFVSSGHNYWLLRPHERPIDSNALNISDLLGDEVSQLEAVVNLKIKADKANKKCVSVDEYLMFYSKV